MEKVVETSEGDYGVTKTNKEISSHSKRDMVFPPPPPPPPTCIITVDFYESNNVRVASLPHKCKLINGRSLTRCKGLELGLC